jgi:predicted transcriptional regulator
MSTVSIPVRVDSEIAEEVKRLAKRRNISTNRLLADALVEYLKAEKAREWRAGFEAMADDRESGDVEYMSDAAAEAFDRADI